MSPSNPAFEASAKALARCVPVAPRSTPNVRIASEQLLAGTREVIIEHGGQEYRLRRTQNDKLILTK
jgi:hemin uptake protein HemP